ncbi:MAG: ferritin family protein [Elusimicrobia bacterium]|nr:ferritin family protein [Elusimicrobiota bacterium]
MGKIKSLEFALDFEIKGTILYLKIAKKTKNILSKQLFYSLASQEVNHAKDVEEIYEQIKVNNNSELDMSKSVFSIEKEIKEYFIRAKNIDLKKDSENVFGYDIAMEMEKKGYSAYANFRENAKNDLEKDFFGQLMKQEKEHLDSLSNVYFYLTKTGDWFQEEESKTWSWMNL